MTKPVPPIVFLDGRVTLHCGDVLAVLRKLPSDSHDCCVVSPPYWGLRDYGTATWEGGDPACDHRSPTMQPGRNEKRKKLAGSAATNSAQLLLAHRSACGKCGAVKVDKQLGLEPTLGEHIAAMVAVFEEVRRVLKPHGTLWLNYGDCFATAPNGRSAADTKALGGDDRSFRDKPFSTVGPINKRGRRLPPGKGNRWGGGNNPAGGYLKPGDLCMVPNRIAIALQDAGWWVKAECIWGKTNPMPDSSGATRPSTAHEKIWLLTKSAGVELWRARDTGEISGQPDLTEQVPFISRQDGKMGPRWIRLPYYYNAEAVKSEMKTSSVNRLAQNVADQTGSTRAVGKTNGNMKAVGGKPDKQRGHSRRHQGLNDRWDAMERADQISGGRLLRNYETAPLTVWRMATEAFSEAHFATFPPELVERCLLAGCPPGGLVLDPFGGSGTVGLVAASLGRRATLIDLNPEYCTLAQARIDAEFMGREGGQRHMIKKLGKSGDAGPLFGGS